VAGNLSDFRQTDIRLPKISYQESGRLAYFNAKILAQGELRQNFGYPLLCHLGEIAPWYPFSKG
jgi:hypothetical protein